MSEAPQDHRQATERILRRAEAKGLDAERAARALNHRAALPEEQQASEEAKPQSWLRRRFARSLVKH